MRYNSSLVLLKYVQYYFAAANSKGHGVHSPYVFKFIQEQLNAKSSMEEIEIKSPKIKKTVEAFEIATALPLPQKIKILIARMLQKMNPSVIAVIGGERQDEWQTENKSIDMAFIGAGMSKGLLLNKATMLLSQMHANSWMILHGIHVDKEMETAWNTLKQNTQVRLTIDLFNIGVLFCRKEQKEQEHFIIRY